MQDGQEIPRRLRCNTAQMGDFRPMDSVSLSLCRRQGDWHFERQEPHQELGSEKAAPLVRETISVDRLC
jgi:hypothetical protein